MMEKKSVRRLGILGGTFDPPHCGHMDLACYVRDTLELDEVILIPTGDPPYKKTNASAKDRYEMVKLSVAQYEKIESNDLEVVRSGTSYTVKTLQDLTQAYPNARLYFIVGADTVDTLSSWYQIEKIFQLSEIVIVSRKGYNGLQKKIEILKSLYSFEPTILDEFVVDISSTQIRNRLEKHFSTAGLVKPSVEAYIQKRKLYTKNSI
ncbi:nicotinate-nucleotide adenylyltransferase [Fusibacter ferrireducens]|uniref:Probable nicotinate-nucleotide adenylyltransferase n=1 Tax=Fusibacter ferrireducens TaxID=2785058 RepID=A0ABR9ZUU7_9FIRM|nr:nicotinate-nucleotide adenylyltransferase [Fusibacter ferrireducens]MBF4693933.1 nicotinate-nucleotide adenylyltransferase [Fusibacter ferrireducens]